MTETMERFIVIEDQLVDIDRVARSKIGRATLPSGANNILFLLDSGLEEVCQIHYMSTDAAKRGLAEVVDHLNRRNKNSLIHNK